MGYQWISRFLANDLVGCDTVMEPFACEILARLAETGEPIPLILDQTKASDRHQILMLSVRWGERALPLAPAFPTDQVRGLKAHGAGLYGAVGCQGLCSTRRLLFLSFSALAAYPQAGADRPPRVRRRRPVDRPKIGAGHCEGHSEGSLPSGAEHRATPLYSVGPIWAWTMMQSCASAAKLRDGRPIL